jgi:hypothetical protein
MKRLALAVSLVTAASAGAQGPVPFLNTNLCTIQATPAPTVLLPYFEVDIDDPNGIDTFLSLNNALPYSVVGHVIVWTDMSVEALDFNIYLTGYDVQTIGMGQIIRNGILPQTSYDDSPIGAFSDDFIFANYAACDLVLPYELPALDEEFLAHLQSILTGGPSSIYNGRCGGFDYGDNIARGYVTVDNVLDCTLLTPCDEGYFVVTEETEIEDYVGFYLPAFWGDWYMVDYANNFAQGDTLVHVESIIDYQLAATVPLEEIQSRVQEVLAARQEGFVIGFPIGGGVAITIPGASFWGRCATVFELFGGAPSKISLDLREPLATTYATRFYQNDAFSGGTDFLVWRDSLFNVYLGEEDGFSCANGPAWFPLNERQVVFFDEQENPDEACTVSPCPQADILFPIEAQRVSVADLDLVQQSGWMYANLNQLWAVETKGGVENVLFAAQGWVEAVHSAEGRFSAGLPAVQLDSACDLRSIVIGPSGPEFPAVEETYPPALLGFYNYNGAPRPAARPESMSSPRNVLP